MPSGKRDRRLGKRVNVMHFVDQALRFHGPGLVCIAATSEGLSAALVH